MLSGLRLIGAIQNQEAASGQVNGNPGRSEKEFQVPKGSLSVIQNGENAPSHEAQKQQKRSGS